MKKRAICCCSILIFAAAVSLSQDITGSITGVVKDSTGAVVPNAQVVAINTATQARFEFTSDSAGAYTARAIPVGVYDLQVS